MMGDDHGGAVEGHIQFVLEPCAVRVEQGFEFRRGQIASWNGVGLYADEVAYKAQCLFNGLFAGLGTVQIEIVPERAAQKGDAMQHDFVVKIGRASWREGVFRLGVYSGGAVS